MYFLTILTKGRRPVFDTPDVVTTCHTEIERAAQNTSFAIDTYGYMPDPLHLLVAGQTGDADLRRFVKLAKQLSGYHLKRLTGRRLWASGFYDRIVRHDEDARRFVRYILMNPIKAGLPHDRRKPPYTWTSRPDLQVGRAAIEQPADTGTPDLKVGLTGPRV